MADWDGFKVLSLPGDDESLPAPRRDRRTSTEAGIARLADLTPEERQADRDFNQTPGNLAMLDESIRSERNPKARAILEDERRQLQSERGAPRNDPWAGFKVVSQPKGADLSPDALNKGASGGYLDAIAKGFADLGTSLQAAKWMATGGDAKGVAQSIAAQLADNRASAGEQEILSASQAVTDAKGAWDTAKSIGNLLWAFASNPYDAGKMTVQQLPNALPSMATGGAGAVTGAKVGGLIGGIGGAKAGALGGGLAGAGAGSGVVEFGARLTEKVGEALQAKGMQPTPENVEALLNDPTFRDDARTEGIAKGVTIGAIDALSMFVGGRIATAPFRAAAKKVLAREGVDLADSAAVNAALKAAPVQAAIKAEIAAIPTARKVGMGAAGVGVDSTMEGVGEYAGEYAATGQGKLGDAILEGITSLGQSTAEVAGSVALQRGRGLISPSVAEQREKAVQDIATAPDVDTAVAAFNRATKPSEPAVDFSADEAAAVNRHAQQRLAALERISQGAKGGQSVDVDGQMVKMPDQPGRFFTAEEKQEYDFLRSNQGNIKAIAQAYGFKPAGGLEFDRLGALGMINAPAAAAPEQVGPQHPLGDPNAIPYDYSTPAQRFAALPAPESPTGSGVLINDADPSLTRPEQYGDRETRINAMQRAREEEADAPGVRDIVQTPEGPRRRARITLDEAGNIIDAPDEHRPFLSLVRRDARPHAAAAIEAHSINPVLTEAVLAAPDMGPRAERTVFEAIINGNPADQQTRALLERYGVPGRLADGNGQGAQPGNPPAPGQQPGDQRQPAGGQGATGTNAAKPDNDNRRAGIVTPPGQIPVANLQNTTPEKVEGKPITARTEKELRLMAKNTRDQGQLKAISDELARRKMQASALVAEGKADAPVSTPRLYVQAPDGRRFEVGNLEEASRKWISSGTQAQRIAMMGDKAVPIVDESGKTVALMDSAGRVSKMTGVDTPAGSDTTLVAPERDVTPAAAPKKLLKPGFDPEAFDRERNERIEASRKTGNVHLDKIPVYVETMRGKRVRYVHDPKVTGTIRTVDTRGNVYIDWADEYSAQKEMASPVQEGKRTVMRSSIGPRDLKDYAVVQEAETPKAKTRAKLDAQKPATAQAAIDAFNADDAKTGMEIVAKLKLDALKEVGAAIGFSVNFTENATRYRERLAAVADRLTKSAREQTGRERKLFDRLSSLAYDWDRMVDHTGAPEGSYDGKWMTHPEARKYLIAELDKLKDDPDYNKVAPMVQKARPRLFDAAETPPPKTEEQPAENRGAQPEQPQETDQQYSRRIMREMADRKKEQDAEAAKAAEEAKYQPFNAADIKKPTPSSMGLTATTAAWFRARFEGRTVWTNGHIVDFAGGPKGAEKYTSARDYDEKSGGQPDIAKIMPKAPATLPGVPVAVYHNQGKEIEYVVGLKFGDKVVAVDRDYFAYFTTTYPGATFMVEPNYVEEGKGQGPMRVMRDGEMIGLAMPARMDDAFRAKVREMAGAAPARPARTDRIGSQSVPEPEAETDALDGFTADMAPMIAARAAAALEKQQGFNGKFMPRKTFIRERVAAGATITQGKEGRRLTMPDGIFMTEADITATAMNFAEYLIGKRESAAAPKAESVSRETPEPEAVAKRRTPKREADAIQDAGQKIGGARKDKWKERGLNLDDLDAMSESEGAELATKANVWKPDYAQMVADGATPKVAAMLKGIYDSLAAQPKDNTPEGRRRYVTMMQAFRQAYSEAIANPGEKTPEQVLRAAMETMKQRIGVIDADNKRTNDEAAKKVLFSVYKGRSDPFVTDWMSVRKAEKLVREGFPEKGEPWKRRFFVRGQGGTGITPRGVELVMEEAAKAGTPLTAEQVKAGYYTVSGTTGGPKAYLPTKEDAEAAAKTLYEQALKANATEDKTPDRPHLDELKREGLAQRTDRDVTADDFIKEFGFRGVEFGNWAAQDERQRILNMAFDGMHDLAEIMGVPPRAMSLNGTMGMAFGARGGGRFAAHYEPGKLVINMTKLRGSGSLAHEFAHALDHYFGELDRQDAYKTKARGASGWYEQEAYTGEPMERFEKVGGDWKKVSKMRLPNLRPELAKAFDNVMSALFQDQETKAQMVRGLELQLERTQTMAVNEQDPKLKAMYQRSVQSQRQNLEETRKEPDDKTYPKGQSQYAKEAQKLSGKSESGYWSRPTEMFARAFESWVFDRLTAMGARSDYLVHGVESDRYAGKGYKGNPYPTGEERARINAAFDRLAKTFITREGDNGNVVLASRPGYTAPYRNLDAYRFTASKDDRGLPVYMSRNITLADGRVKDALGVPKGGRAIAFDIYDNRMRDAEGEPTVVGQVLVHQDAAGKFVSFRNISIAKEYRDQGYYHGEGVVAGMLQHNGIVPMEVFNIQSANRGDKDDALPFWKKIGTTILNYSSTQDVDIEGNISLARYKQAGEKRGNNGQSSRDSREQPIPRRDGARGEQSDAGGDRRAQSVSRRQSGTVRAVRAELVDAFGEAGIAALEREGILQITTWDNAPKGLTNQLESGDHGAYWPSRKTAFIFADNLAPGQAVEVLLHEIGEHYGLKEMLGDRYDKVVNQVKTLHKAGNRAIVDAWKHVERNYDHKPGSPIFMQEVIAKAGQSADVRKMAWWQRLIADVKAFLIKVGLKNVTSERDLGILLRASVRRAMRDAGEIGDQASSVLAARAFHGTPHNVDRFSTDKINTGEGAQAYGWGLYFAENPGVAEGYRKSLAGSAFEYADTASHERMRMLTNFDDWLWDYVRTAGADANYDAKTIAARLEENAQRYSKGREEMREIARMIAQGKVKLKPAGAVYQVDIPDEVVARMLDWDRPLSEQPEIIQRLRGTDYEVGLSEREIERLADERIDNEAADWADETGGDPVDFSNNVDRDAYIEQVRQDQGGIDPAMTGAKLYKRIVKDEGYNTALFDSDYEYQKGASEYLDSLGIPGIKYLDAGSRPLRTAVKVERSPSGRWMVTDQLGGKHYFDTEAQARAAAKVDDDATRNLVVFNDKNITITHKDGTPVTAKERAELVMASRLSDQLKGMNKDAGGDLFKGAPELDKPLSDAQARKAWNAMLDKVGVKGLAGLVFNWNEGELSEDGSKIINFAGRDRAQTMAGQGGSYRNSKAEFVRWLMSDAPFDAAKIQQDAEWRAEVDAARQASGLMPDDAPLASRGTIGATWDMLQSAKTPAQARALAMNLFDNPNKFNLWDKTIGTQLNKARKNEYFRAVFDNLQGQQDSTAAYAIEAEAEAADVLARMEGMGEIKSALKSTLTGERAKDLREVSKAIFSNIEGEQGVKQKVYTDAELAKDFGLNERQIGLYRQSRAAIDRSLDRYAQSLAVRTAQKFVYTGDLHRAGLDDTVTALTERLRLQRQVLEEQREPEQSVEDMEARLAELEEMRDSAPREILRSLQMGPDGEMRQEYANLSDTAAAAALDREIRDLKKAIRSGDEFNPANRELDAKIQALDAVLSKLPEIQEQANSLKDKGYAPAMRFGDYAVTATQDGETVFFTMVDTKTQANLLKMRLAKELPGADLRVNPVDRESFKLFGGVDPATVELFARFMEVEENDAFKAYIALATSSRSALKHMLERKGVAGFSDNLPRVLAAFITSNSRAAARNIHGFSVNEAMETVQKKARGDVSEEAAKLVNYMNNPTGDFAKVRGFMFAYFMGGSVSSALVNLTQPVMMTAPYLSQFAGAKTAGIMARASKAAATGKVEGAMKAALDRAEAEGITDAHEYHQLMQEAEGGGTVATRALMKAWGSMFGAAERFNRRITFLAAYETAQGMTREDLNAQGVGDAYEFAKNAVVETQGIYARHNRPNWARNPVGALALTFKQFGVAYLEFFMRLPRKQQLMALGLLVLMAGIEGLPFAEDLEDLIDTIGQRMGYGTNSKRALHQAATGLGKAVFGTMGETAAQFALHGISGISGIPMDVAGRLGMGNLIPGTKLLNPSVKEKAREVAEIAGPAAGLVQKAGGLADGQIKEAMPKAFADAAKAWEMLQTGEYRDTKGRKVMEVDGLDTLMKLIGFQPAEIAAKSRFQDEQRRDINIVKTVEADIVEQWADGVREKDVAKSQEARERLKRWNEENPDLPIKVKFSQVLQRVRMANLTRDERFMKSAPPELRRRMLAETAQ